MPSYLTWSNKFVITYYIDENGFQRKKTRRATSADKILPYQTPKPICPKKSCWNISLINEEH